MGEETPQKAEKGAAAQYRAEAEFAEGILEELLSEADEAIREANEAFEDRGLPGRWPPFDITRHHPRPEIAHLCYTTTILNYKLEGEEWDEKDETQLHSWLALLKLPVSDVAHEVYSRCNDLLEDFLSTNYATDKEGHRHLLSAVVSPELRKQLLERFVYDTIEYIIYRLDRKLNTALNELWHEAYFLASNSMAMEMMGAMWETGVEVIHDPNEPTEKMNRLLAKFAGQRKEVLKSDLAERLGLLDFTELAEHYNRLLPVWKDAKSIYKQNIGRKAWRDLIRAEYEDTEFPDDLLSRLTGNLKDLPEEIRAKLRAKGGITKKDGASTPSSIALEHAARLCGAEPYQYSVRHLYNIKNETRDKP